MLRPPVAPKKRTPPATPEVDPAWIEALNNTGTTATNPNAGAVAPKMPYTNVRQADEALTSRSQAQQNYRDYYDQRVPVRTGDVYNNSLKSIAGVGFRHGIQYPVESLHRTLTLQNAPKYLNPFNDASVGQRLGALGEDAVNIAGIIPFTRAAAQGVPEVMAGVKTAKNQLAASMSQKFTPTASLDNYILHGGVHPDKLAGGMLDPDYVRGGDLFLRKGEAGMMPVNTGPNQYERDFILGNFQGAEDALAGKITQKGGNSRFRIYENPRDVGKATIAEMDAINNKTRTEAQAFIDKHSEIVSRIRAGQEHQTGVGRLNPNDTYVSSGGNYVLDIPSNLRTVDSPAPSGEIKFWGKHKPVGFVGRDNPQELINKSTLQIMLDDADIKAGQTQKLANMIARARGTKITPAYKTFAEETFNKFLNKSYRPFYENPNYNGVGLQYFEDFNKEAVPYIKNYNEAIAGIKSAKTEKEIFDIIDNLIPNDDLDIALRQQFNQPTKLGIQDLKNKVVNFMSGINPEYSRLKNVPRNGPVVIDKAPYPKNLVNWDSLREADPNGQMFAFANQFMDRRTPPEVIQQVFDEDLYKLMFSDPEKGQRILNERLANIGKPSMPDWSSLTPDERAFATTFNRNTPASVIKQAMIEHDMNMEGTLQRGIRDIAQTMAERQGMDMTQAYDVAETFSNWLKRGGQRPGRN